MTQRLPLDASDDTWSPDPTKEPITSLHDESLSNDPELFIRKTFESNPQKGCELLFRIYYPALCTHAVRFVYSKEVAEDVVSEIFYNFWKTQAYRSITTSYRAYLFRSVRNRSYNYLTNDLRKSDPLSAAVNPEAPESESPERIMQMDELLAILNQLIASLPSQCQKVFLMNRFEGLKSKEIAQELHISPRTVETHIFKALTLLKNGLKNQWLWIASLVFWS